MLQLLMWSPRTEQPSLLICCLLLEEPWDCCLDSPSSVQWRSFTLLQRYCTDWYLRRKKIVLEDRFVFLLSFKYFSFINVYSQLLLTMTFNKNITIIFLLWCITSISLHVVSDELKIFYNSGIHSWILRISTTQAPGHHSYLSEHSCQPIRDQYSLY